MSISPRFYDFERPFRMMERNFYQPDDFFNYHPMVSNDFFAPEFFRPWDNVFRRWEKYFPPMDELRAAMNKMALNDVGQNITMDNEKFQVNVDVQHFAPEEINVKVVDGQVTIEGKHEEKKDEHGYISRRFVRKYTLPQECLPDTVESRLSSDGVLTVTAPKVIPLPSTGEKIVPITYTGPVKKQPGSPDYKQANKKLFC